LPLVPLSEHGSRRREIDDGALGSLSALEVSKLLNENMINYRSILWEGIVFGIEEGGLIGSYGHGGKLTKAGLEQISQTRVWSWRRNRAMEGIRRHRQRSDEEKGDFMLGYGSCY